MALRDGVVHPLAQHRGGHQVEFPGHLEHGPLAPFDAGHVECHSTAPPLAGSPEPPGNGSSSYVSFRAAAQRPFPETRYGKRQVINKGLVSVTIDPVRSRGSAPGVKVV
ncbi:hypothetical protein GCM10018980_62360 [Streptomyces capoamus]|uniref:Uncharacterized protein n=1 Tax=Streptomyces capoamus TaxID=68183 RepID=A0A919F1E9_9ACTN|nr:hypothetical protein GCM10018980_62360 [Streptomyces capoamus]